MNKIGRYELNGELGRGAMGVVYRAHDSLLDRDIALKTLSAEGVHDRELLERFYREARLCAKLQHPNIVTVYDLGQEAGVAYIAMELLDGADLRRMIGEGVQISLEDKTKIISAVSEGLDYAHSVGVVHRDIKPSNVFVSKDGRPRILDFGVAHLPASSLTVVGRVLGTPYYMSPEQISGANCGARSDLFSLAVVAYEFISGEHPYQKQPVNQVLAHESGPLLPGTPAMPNDVLEVLRRAASRVPDDRYASAAEFSRELLSAASGQRQYRVLDTAPLPERPPVFNGGTQTVLSAVLISLQEFEQAADRSDVHTAREALQAMRRAAGGDPRFAVAVQESAKRIAELEKELRVSTPSLTKDVQEAPPALKPAALDATSLFQPQSLTVDAKFFPGSPTPAPAPRLETLLPLYSRPVLPVHTPTPPQPADLVERDETNGIKQRRSFGRALFVLLSCVLIAAGVYAGRTYLGKKPQRLPAAATAEVLSPEAHLFALPDSNQSPVATLHHGDIVNVLRAPRFQEQQWTEVQWISAGRVSPAVFARTADLANWSSSDPILDEQLRQMFPPAPVNNRRIH